MLPYAAYLRVYEPLSAFDEPERSRWAAYAAAPRPPRRVRTLEAEHAEAIRRLIAVPPIVAPARENHEAYVRRADGVVYVCPWQTRLRSWLALGRLRATLPPALMDTLVPRRIADGAAADFARWHVHAASLRTHILTSTWQVPLAWFVPFGPPERWLALGGAGSDPGLATATRALIYLTTMGQARRRVARAIGAMRRGLSGPPAGSHPYRGQRPTVGERSAHVQTRAAGGATLAAVAEVEEVGRWLKEFHPRALVELDYGGLVHLLDDGALRADQSVAETAAAITGLETGEVELAVAMYRRLNGRWRALQAARTAS